MVDKARHDFIQLSYIYGAALLCVLLLSSLAAPVHTSHDGIIVPLGKKQEDMSSVYDSSAFSGVDVHAKAYVVYDLVDKKVIASKNADEPLPLASITKLMMGITALTHHDKNMLITIKPGSIEDGYDFGLKKGQVWKLGELLKYTLVFSSNDGAHTIADTLEGRKDFIAQMNTDATLLGLNLTFTDPAGLDIGNDIGGKGSALQVAKLFEIARRKYPELLDATTKTRLNALTTQGRLTGIPNTNQEINNLFGAEASKTGFTDSAGGNLGVVVDVSLGHPVVIVVLGSTREDRFTDTEKLYKALVTSLK